jgi:hypothetical protein
MPGKRLLSKVMIFNSHVLQPASLRKFALVAKKLGNLTDAAIKFYDLRQHQS